jgi:hypothetical protein
MFQCNVSLPRSFAHSWLDSGADTLSARNESLHVFQFVASNILHEPILALKQCCFADRFHMLLQTFKRELWSVTNLLMQDQY